MEQLEQFYEELLQEASKARFIKAIEGLTDEEKQEFIDFFDSHVNAQNMINWNNKSELTKENLERVVNEVKAKADAKKKAHDKYRLGRNDPLLMFTSKPEMFDILKVDDKWIFAYCKSHAACNFADSFECGGAGAKWCVGWTNKPEHWNSYTGRGMEFVLAYNKKGDPKKENDLKYMIQIDPNGQTQAWLQTDHSSDTIKLDKFEEFFGLELEKDAEGSSTDKPAVIEGNVYVKPPIKRLSNDRGVSGTLKIGKRSFDVSFKAGYYRENANSISEIIVPEGIEVIARGCFSQYYDRLEKIVLPSTLKEIRDNAFTASYNSASEVVLEIPENVEKISDSAFNRCIAKKIIFRGDKFRFVDSNGGDNITNPFRDFLQKPCNRRATYVDQLDCLNKTSKNLIIQKIGNGENSVIGYIISQLMPNGSEKLLTVNLPTEVETNAEIRAYLDKFTDTAKLAFSTSDFIMLSSKITHIKGPITDTAAQTLVIPESVEEISCDAFKVEGNHYALFDKIVILSKKFKFVPAEGHKNLEDPFSQALVNTLTLANGHDIYSVEEIGNVNYLISNENGKRILLGAGIPGTGIAKKMELPSNIYAIANNVMSGRTILVNSITIPDSVRLIGSGALKGVICNTTVYIGKNVVGIGNDSLPGAKCVILPAGLKFLGKPNETFNKTSYRNFTIILTNTDAELANKFISQYPDINMIYNPEVINTDSASIKGVISAGNMVMSITKDAKGPIALPASVTFVNTEAASHATNITSLSFKSKSIEFQYASFYSCTKLVEVTFPERVIFNGHWCFSNCKRLTSIKFAPVSIISFNGRGAFDNCKSLEKVVLPEGLLNLGDSTFSKCINLTDITLPSTLTNFGSQVFLGTDLCRIKYNGTKAQWLALIKTLKATRRSDQKILQSLVLCRDGFMLGKNAISIATAKQYLVMLNQRLANKR